MRLPFTHTLWASPECAAENGGRGPLVVDPRQYSTMGSQPPRSIEKGIGYFRCSVSTGSLKMTFYKWIDINTLAFLLSSVRGEKQGVLTCLVFFCVHITGNKQGRHQTSVQHFNRLQKPPPPRLWLNLAVTVGGGGWRQAFFQVEGKE